MAMILIITFVLVSLAVIMAFTCSAPKKRLLAIFRTPQDEMEANLKILDREPFNTPALEYLANTYFEEKNYEVAYDYYSRLVIELARTKAGTMSRNRYPIYLNFGISAYHTGEKKEALTGLQKAKMAINNMRTFTLFYYIGLIHFEEGNY
ncbi:MAG: tetratricopeptide repeat protein, partial [Spirochaetota bacterium]